MSLSIKEGVPDILLIRAGDSNGCVSEVCADDEINRWAAITVCGADGAHVDQPVNHGHGGVMVL